MRSDEAKSIHSQMILQYSFYDFSTSYLQIRSLVHRWNAFLQNLFYILIQIFHNMQNFPGSWITKISTFFMFGYGWQLSLRSGIDVYNQYEHHPICNKNKVWININDSISKRLKSNIRFSHLIYNSNHANSVSSLL